MEPIHVHIVATKHVMRYLKGTLDCGLTYATNVEIRLHGYTDSDWDGNIDDMKKYFRMLFKFGIRCDLMA